MSITDSTDIRDEVLFGLGDARKSRPGIIDSVNKPVGALAVF